MKLSLNHLANYPKVFQQLTGLRVREFEALLDELDIPPNYDFFKNGPGYQALSK